MAVYQKTSMVSGAWASGADLKNVKRAKIVSETNPEPSNFKNKDGSVKMQNVCKVSFENQADSLNVSLNRATINGLVDAFGEDSKNWQGHYLAVEVEKVRQAGKSGYSIYLIPEGYKKIDDENGYAVIVKEGANVKIKDEDIPVINSDIDRVNAELAGQDEDDEPRIDLKNIPF